MKKKVRSFAVKEELYRQLCSQAQSSGLSRSELVEMALLKAFNSEDAAACANDLFAPMAQKDGFSIKKRSKSQTLIFKKLAYRFCPSFFVKTDFFVSGGAEGMVSSRIKVYIVTERQELAFKAKSCFEQLFLFYGEESSALFSNAFELSKDYLSAEAAASGSVFLINQIFCRFLDKLNISD